MLDKVISVTGFVIVVVSVFLISIIFIFALNPDTNHNEVYEIGDYNAKSKVVVLNIKERIISIQLEGKNELIELGEEFIVKGKHKHMIGSIKVVEINEGSAVLSVDLKKDIKFS